MFKKNTFKLLATSLIATASLAVAISCTTSDVVATDNTKDFISKYELLSKDITVSIKKQVTVESFINRLDELEKLDNTLKADTLYELTAPAFNDLNVLKDIVNYIKKNNLVLTVSHNYTAAQFALKPEVVVTFETMIDNLKISAQLRFKDFAVPITELINQFKDKVFTINDSYTKTAGQFVREQGNFAQLIKNINQTINIDNYTYYKIEKLEAVDDIVVATILFDKQTEFSFTIKGFTHDTNHPFTIEEIKDRFKDLRLTFDIKSFPQITALEFADYFANQELLEKYLLDVKKLLNLLTTVKYSFTGIEYVDENSVTLSVLLEESKETLSVLITNFSTLEQIALQKEIEETRKASVKQFTENLSALELKINRSKFPNLTSQQFVELPANYSTIRDYLSNGSLLLDAFKEEESERKIQFKVDGNNSDIVIIIVIIDEINVAKIKVTGFMSEVELDQQNRGLVRQSIEVINDIISTTKSKLLTNGITKEDFIGFDSTIDTLLVYVHNFDAIEAKLKVLNIKIDPSSILFRTGADDVIVEFTLILANGSLYKTSIVIGNFAPATVNYKKINQLNADLISKLILNVKKDPKNIITASEFISKTDQSFSSLVNLAGTGLINNYESLKKIIQNSNYQIINFSLAANNTVKVQVRVGDNLVTFLITNFYSNQEAAALRKKSFNAAAQQKLNDAYQQFIEDSIQFKVKPGRESLQDFDIKNLGLDWLIENIVNFEALQQKLATQGVSMTKAGYKSYNFNEKIIRAFVELDLTQSVDGVEPLRYEFTITQPYIVEIGEVVDKLNKLASGQFTDGVTEKQIFSHVGKNFFDSGFTDLITTDHFILKYKYPNTNIVIKKIVENPSNNAQLKITFLVSSNDPKTDYQLQTTVEIDKPTEGQLVSRIASDLSDLGYSFAPSKSRNAKTDEMQKLGFTVGMTWQDFSQYLNDNLIYLALNNLYKKAVIKIVNVIDEPKEQFYILTFEITIGGWTRNFTTKKIPYPKTELSAQAREK